MAIPKRLLKISKWLLILIVIVIVMGFVLFSYQTEVTKNIDNYIYELPFEKGARHRIVQGYGGLFSHSHIAALDFEMPVGTFVCAARDEWSITIKIIAMKADFFHAIRTRLTI